MKTLVSDFDGTLTEFDFYRLAIQRLIPQDLPDYWQAYRRGDLTHFEALNNYFQAIRARPEEIENVMKDMRLEPQLPSALARLRERDWQVVVTSAGCSWYIERLLNDANVQLEVHASPGTFHSATGLRMELPLESPFLNREQGIDKAAVVAFWLEHSEQVAFAGDGFTDVKAASLVSENHRFARRDLAMQLKEDGMAFRTFDRWLDIVDCLLDDQ